MSYSGSCHCGNIAYTVDGDIDQVMACNCSICGRRGYLLWFVPRSALHLSTPESNLATYTFNKHVIRHHFCATCGCAPFGIGADVKGNEMVAINARCLEGVEPASLKTVQYDGRAV
jgi:hypothetical protein